MIILIHIGSRHFAKSFVDICLRLNMMVPNTSQIWRRGLLHMLGAWELVFVNSVETSFKISESIVLSETASTEYESSVYFIELKSVSNITRFNVIISNLFHSGLPEFDKRHIVYHDCGDSISKNKILWTRSSTNHQEWYEFMFYIYIL